MYAYFNIYRIAFSPHVGFFSGWGNKHIFGYLEDSPPPYPTMMTGKGTKLPTKSLVSFRVKNWKIKSTDYHLVS